MASDIDKELHQTVLGIVHELEAAVSGSLYDIDGDFVIIDDMDEWKEEQYKKKVDAFREEHSKEPSDPKLCGLLDPDEYKEFMESEIGTVDDVDEPDEVSLSEYIDNRSLGDVLFEVDSSKDLHGGKVLFCFGGPNVWVDDDGVRGYWGSSTMEMSLDSDTRSELFSLFEEMWDAVRG